MKYGENFTSDQIKLTVCDDFIEGYYFPKGKEIYICANMLTNYENSLLFNQALKRLVRWYYFVNMLIC